MKILQIWVKSAPFKWKFAPLAPSSFLTSRWAQVLKWDEKSEERTEILKLKNKGKILHYF